MNKNELVELFYSDWVTGCVIGFRFLKNVRNLPSRHSVQTAIEFNHASCPLSTGGTFAEAKAAVA
jgi:hypothetical protein